MTLQFPLHERPVRTDKVKFADESTSDYQPPINTLDPRYAACTDHRVGCDCREADLREDIADFKADYDVLRAAIEKVVGDHPTWLDPHATETNPKFWERPGCQCTGCQIVRLANDKAFWKALLR